MNQRIIDAITNRQLVRFQYDGGVRVVEPYCYGRTKKGTEVLRAYQVSGYSSSGNMGWKLFDLHNATSLEFLEEEYDTIREGYRKGDKAMIKIFCEIDYA